MPFRLTARVLFLLLAASIAHRMSAAKPHHPPRHAAHSQIESLEEQWRTAAMTGDLATMDKLLSDDYLGISANGDLLTKQQQLDRMRTRQFSLSQLDPSDLKIKLLGQIAIVTSRAKVNGVNDGKPMQGTFRYTRVYKHVAGGSWKVTSFEATRIPKAGRDGSETRE